MKKTSQATRKGSTWHLKNLRHALAILGHDSWAGAIFRNEGAFLKKTLFIMIFCLALTACGKKKDLTAPALPAGYTVKDRAYFAAMENCIQYARQKIQSANVENLQESNSGEEYTASGNLKTSDAVLYFCSPSSDSNATFTYAVKPAS